MERRRKSLWLLAALLLTAGILTIAQDRAARTGHPSAAQAPAIAALRPARQGLGATGGFWHELVAQATQKAWLASQEEKLRRKCALLAVQNSHLQHVAEENQRLRQMLAMREHDPSGSHWVVADVVERHPSHWFQSITLDRGEDAGIRVHSVALTPKGLVGQVILVRSDSCDVLLLTDPSSDAGAIVDRTHDVGYVQGKGQKDLALRFFEHDHGVKFGDRVATSPFSSIYPHGVTIGWITSVHDDNGATTRTATVRPSVEFNSLEEVIVVP